MFHRWKILSIANISLQAWNKLLRASKNSYVFRNQEPYEWLTYLQMKRRSKTSAN